MIVYEDLLREVVSEKKHTFLSTGMASEKHIDRAVEIGGFIALVGAVRKIEKSMGDGVIGIYKKEVSIAQKLRARIPWESSE